MLILFYILTCIYITEAKVKVTSLGLATIVRGDTGMMFYATLHNVGEFVYNVNVRMVKCCEILEDNDLECKMMQLIGGDTGFLYQQQLKNITLFYPNMYLHNRRGKCLICIKYVSETNCTIEAKESIKFDTYIRGPTSNSVVLRDYYKTTEYTKCPTIDLDPLDNCEPVNCQMKYLGFRNFFNIKWSRCQKVPVCISNPKKFLPDVAYIPLSNMCMDLENVISPKDLKVFEEAMDGEVDKPQISSLPTANLRCHHGHYSNQTGLCVCDEGWMSALLDKDQYEPSLGIYHMCNIQISTWNRANYMKIKMTFFVITMLGALIAITIVMLAIFCHLLYKCCVRSNKGENKTAAKGSEKENYGSDKPESEMSMIHSITRNSIFDEGEEEQDEEEAKESEVEEDNPGENESEYSIDMEESENLEPEVSKSSELNA